MKMPLHADDPPQILMWEMDEFILLFLFFVGGILAERLTTALIVGVVLVRLYRKMRGQRLRGSALHILYWRLGIGARGSFVNPFSRRFF